MLLKVENWWQDLFLSRKLQVYVLSIIISQIIDYALMVCALCNSSTLFFDSKDQMWKCTGDPTESALEVLAQKLNVSKEE